MDNNKKQIDFYNIKIHEFFNNKLFFYKNNKNQYNFAEKKW